MGVLVSNLSKVLVVFLVQCFERDWCEEIQAEDGEIAGELSPECVAE